MRIIANLRELYAYRDLIRALVVRHLAVRYRGSVLGFLWSFLNPLCLMLVYMLVFKYYVRFNQVDNYTIFLFTGLLPWLWLQSGLLEGTTSIVSSGHLITKSMFPAQILPAVSVITTLVHFVLSLPLLFIFMLAAGMTIHWTLIFLPLVIAAQLIVVFGSTLLLSSLNVHYRDVQHILGNLLTFLFFLCPILYPASVVPEKLRFTLDWNPLAALTTAYHNVIIDGVVPAFQTFGLLGVFAGVTFMLGYWTFERYKEGFAELL